MYIHSLHQLEQKENEIKHLKSEISTKDIIINKIQVEKEKIKDSGGAVSAWCNAIENAISSMSVGNGEIIVNPVETKTSDNRTEATTIKAMCRMNPKWGEHILVSHKLDFGNADDQFMIAKDDETDEETLYELSLVAKNNKVRKAILAHHNCTIDIARNMFIK